MTDNTPTVVAVFDLGSWEPRRVAEFRLTPGKGVELAILVPEGCPLAEQWYRQGVEILGEARYVTSDDGVAFMHALLQPFRMSYYDFVDESRDSGS